MSHPEIDRKRYLHTTLLRDSFCKKVEPKTEKKRKHTQPKSGVWGIGDWYLSLLVEFNTLLIVLKGKSDATKGTGVPRLS